MPFSSKHPTLHAKYVFTDVVLDRVDYHFATMREQIEKQADKLKSKKNDSAGQA